MYGRSPQSDTSWCKPQGGAVYAASQDGNGRKLKPTVLVATTSRWFPTARLAMALAKAGFIVKAVCPSHHPLGTTGALTESYAYRGLAPLASFTTAIRTGKPDIIIPGDDLATQHLHAIFRHTERAGRAGQAMRGLIEYSLGAADSFATVYARAKLLELAQGEGVRVAETALVEDQEGLRTCIARMGLPLAIKADGSSGGEGVRIVHTAEEAAFAFRALAKPPYWLRAAKRALINHDTTLLWPSLLRRRPMVNAQAFVPGTEATSTVACWKGKVVAALHFDVIHTTKSRGPATVLRLIDDAEMSAATEKIVGRLNLSGFHGFDFMRQTQTGNVYLIEMNPRTTQVGHLSLGKGRDLCAALYAAVSGETCRTAPAATDNDLIALFPHEWMRDASSPFLRSAYHDVPWESPALVQACLRAPRPRSSTGSSQEAVESSSEVLLASRYSRSRSVRD